MPCTPCLHKELIYASEWPLCSKQSLRRASSVNAGAHLSCKRQRGSQGRLHVAQQLPGLSAKDSNFKRIGKIGQRAKQTRGFPVGGEGAHQTPLSSSRNNSEVSQCSELVRLAADVGLVQAMKTTLHKELSARSACFALLSPPRHAEPRPRPAVPCSSATLFKGAARIRSSDIRAPHKLVLLQRSSAVLGTSKWLTVLACCPS